jgi:carboxyl-terminal processing protease
LVAGTPTLLQAQTPRLDDFRHEARECEKRHDWEQACFWYDEALKKDRNHAECREGYLRCQRHYYLARRHADPGYKRVVSGLEPSDALKVYGQVLARVSVLYVDPKKADLSRLFQHGLQELRFALEEPLFVRAYLADVKPEVIRGFLGALDQWRGTRVKTPEDARAKIWEVITALQDAGVETPKPLIAAIALEFANGACNALDEYTLFLTPGHYADVQAAMRGKFVGIGVEVAVVEQRLEIARVYANSPAEDAGLAPRQVLRKIDGRSVENLPAEIVAGRLRGRPGSIVTLEVGSRDAMGSRVVKLARRAVLVPSVEFRMLSDAHYGDYTGYLRILCFQESTVQEVKDALAQFQAQGGRDLILDLRGNPGGLFHPAVQVAELFLSGGVIVYTRSTVKEYNRPYKSEAGMNALALPLVVLVDGDTASSAEVLAGALKEQGRARLLGQPTFGKSTIQGLIPLDKAPLSKTPGGIRISVARFSPTGKFVDNARPILPDELLDPDADAIDAAHTYLRSFQNMMNVNS